MRYFILFFLISVTAYAQPDWAKDTQKRTIKNGDTEYIAFVGYGEDPDRIGAANDATLDGAKKVVEECGHYSKNIVVIDSGREFGDINKSWKLVGISKKNCKEDVDDPDVKKMLKLQEEKLELKEDGKNGDQEFYNEYDNTMAKWLFVLVDQSNKDYKAEAEAYEKAQEEKQAKIEEEKAAKQAEIDAIEEEKAEKEQEKEEAQARKHLDKFVKEQEAAMAKLPPAARACWKTVNQMEWQNQMHTDEFGKVPDELQNEVEYKKLECQEMK